MLQRAFGALEKKSVAVADADDPRERMIAAELGGADEDFEFARTLADGVTG